MSKGSPVAKPSALTYELMLVGHAAICVELRRINAGYLPRTHRDPETLRRVLAAIEDLMADCRKHLN